MPVVFDMVFIFLYCAIAGAAFALGGDIADKITKRLERERRRRR